MVNNVANFTSSTNADIETELEFPTDQRDDLFGKKKKDPIPDFAKFEMKLQHTSEPYNVNMKISCCFLVLNLWLKFTYRNGPENIILLQSHLA